MSALMDALQSGFGVETDVRDFAGNLVISHDLATSHSLSLNDFLEAYHKVGGHLALNIKADGLCEILFQQLKQYDVTNYFVFDMSVPEMYRYSERGLKYFTRQSDLEESPILLPKATGIWVDTFEHDWINFAVLSDYLSQGKSLGIVSPELHGHPYQLTWQRYREFFNQLRTHGNKILLCTDHPQEAKEFFDA